MKSIIIAVLSFFAAVANASAGSYCQTQSNAERCYVIQIKTQAGVINSAIGRFQASVRYTGEQKQAIEQNQRDWVRDMMNSCGNSYECIEQSSKERAMALNTEYVRVHGK